MSAKIKKKVAKVQSAESEADDNLVELIKQLQSIKLDSKLAKLNATSISDNNGGRIWL